MSNVDEMFSLLHLSESTSPFSKAALRELLSKSRESNSTLEVTGMFLFKEGHFLQVLEGPQKTVMPL